MSFGISGFGGEQTRPQPQLFQALSLGGGTPAPPAPPYGTPNQHLVPVARPATVLPANLTLAAAPTFQAILNLTPVASQHPPVASAPNSTAANAATNPAITQQDEAASDADGAFEEAQTPQGPVSFTLTVAPAYVTSDAQALAQTTQQLAQAQSQTQSQQQTQNQPQTTQPSQNVPAKIATQTQSVLPAQATPASVGTATIPPAANASAVNAIVATVRGLAISAIYPASIFSFSA